FPPIWKISSTAPQTQTFQIAGDHRACNSSFSGCLLPLKPNPKETNSLTRNPKNFTKYCDSSAGFACADFSDAVIFRSSSSAKTTAWIDAELGYSPISARIHNLLAGGYLRHRLNPTSPSPPETPYALAAVSRTASPRLCTNLDLFFPPVTA
ncbi:hypothetical protein U1Q18_005690, partial [Sarracenia purpurea var. burkii]